MSAMGFFPVSGQSGATALADKVQLLRARFGPLAAIVAAHMLLFYAVNSGLLHRAVQAALPEEVMVSFVAPAAPPSPEPAAPVTFALAAPPPMRAPPPPLLDVAAPERAVSAPQPVLPKAEKMLAPVEKVQAVAVAAATPPPAAGPRTITSGVEYVQAPQPVYPPISKRMGEQGKVILRILVSEKGLAEQVVVQASSGFSRLDEAGRQAALRALFKPHIEDGRPVAVFVIVPLTFQLAS